MIIVRFLDQVNPDESVTLSWLSGFPPSIPDSVSEKFVYVRSTNNECSIGDSAENQAIQYMNALAIDCIRVNGQGESYNELAITRLGADVYVTPRNGSSVITGITDSDQVEFNPTVDSFLLLAEPQAFTPAYNPVIYRFFSANYAQPGFRYLVKVYKRGLNTEFTISSEQIASYKVVPEIDGTGYIDISKLLQNFVTIDFDQSVPINNNCSNSYLDYDIQIDEEYIETWVFDSIYQSGFEPILVNSFNQPFTFIVGDQINIVTDLPPESPWFGVNGLHTVTATNDEIGNMYINIDMLVTGSVTEATNIMGTANFLDGRKTTHIGVTPGNCVVFNGVRSWVEFPNWNYLENVMQITPAVTPLPKLLTSLPTFNNEPIEDNKFYITSGQQLYLNFLTENPLDTKLVQWFAGNVNEAIETGEYVIDDTTSNYGPLQQFRICPEELIIFSPRYDEIDYIIFVVIRLNVDIYENVSSYYKVYLDKRCRNEKYELYFMDRMGSILSYSCQLRSKETGVIKRETHKEQTIYNSSSRASYANIYNTYDRGLSTSHIDLTKSLELNTNWMTDQMSVLFEELLSSPFVWLRTVIEATDTAAERNQYTSVIVTENDFEVQRQKNKRLIRKTITVKAANENNINI